MSEENKPQKPQIQVSIVKAGSIPGQVSKAETSTHIPERENNTPDEWLDPPMPLEGLRTYVTHSSILPQCIRAYKNNIAGFGIGIKYKDEFSDVDETPEMEAEYDRAKRVIDLLTLDMDTKELFEDVIEIRETYGISYCESIRNGGGEVVELAFIKDSPTIRKTKRLPPFVDVEVFYNGEKVTRRKQFRKYKQTVGSKTVYFKEFGDPRMMDNRTGKYVEEGEAVPPLEYQANEIIEFAIGTEPYGEVRWIGQILGIAGSRQAEELNKNYFDNGRHTPMMIMVQGGTLSPDSHEKLQEYMNGIRGAAGQHAFLLLEVEENENSTGLEDAEKPKVQIEDLASILQKDELFQEYIDNGRRKVQSAFQLPDLYVGYTTEFNRATAQTAQEVTEQQVFQPERRSLAWSINNQLLSEYAFKYVEAYFLAPDVTNPEDLYKMMVASEKAGGITPNKAKEVFAKMLGESSEPYEGDWGDIPLAFSRPANGMAAAGVNMDSIMEQLSGQIKKAQCNAEPEELVAVMKEVRKVLEELAG